MIPILILAAGASSRMRGGDKLLEPVQGQPLLRLQALRALATGEPVFVAAGPADTTRMRAIADLDVTILTVTDAAEGMSATMRNAVAQLPEAQAFMMVLGDLVAVETRHLNAMIQARDAHPGYLIWRGATIAGAPGHPIVFDQSLVPEFAKLTGDGGGEALVQPLIDQTYLVPFAGNVARLDLDTPEDWAAWRRTAL